jgi:hypothetical protein
VLVAWTFVAAEAVADHRTQRELSRAPVFTTDAASTVAYWHITSAYLDDRQFPVIHVAPAAPDAAPPPGLPRWPRPGEAFLSPALVAADDTVARRYGEYAGVIADAGLLDSTEWLVYTRPHDRGSFDRLDRNTSIRGVGQVGQDYPPTHLELTIGRTELRWLLVVALGLPALVLMAVSVRTGAERRDRRLARLDALGVPRVARGWMVVGEAATPVAAGAALGAGGAFASTLVDAPVPGTGLVVWADDLAGARGWLPVLWALVVIGVLAMAALMQVRPTAGGQTRPQSLAQQLRYWPQVVFPVALSVTILTASFGAGSAAEFGLPPVVIAFLVALIVTLATLPAVASAIVSWFGARVARLGTPAALVGGRWLAARPMLTARLVAAVAVGLGITSQLAVVATLDTFGTGWRPEAATEEAVVIYARGASEAARAQFTATVGADRVFEIRAGQGGYTPTLTIRCADLRRIGRNAVCPDEPVPAVEVFDASTALQRSVVFEIDTVTTEPSPEAEPWGFFVLNPGGRDGGERIQRAAHRTLPLVTARWAGQLGRSVEPSMGIRVRWMTAAGAAGLLLLVIAGGLAVLSLAITQTRALGVLTGIGAPPGLFARLAWWNVGLPLLSTLVASVVMAAFLARLAVRLRGSGHLPWTFLGTSAAICVLLSVFITAAAALLAVRASPHWRPTAD